MGILTNLRGSRTGTTQEGIPISNVVSTVNKRKWSNLMPLFVGLVVIAEIGFLGRLDMAKNAALVDSWTDLFSRSPPSHEVVVHGVDGLGLGLVGDDRGLELESCEDWLEKEDAVEYSRNFEKEPILVSGAEQVCAKFGFWCHTNLIYFFLSFM